MAGFEGEEELSVFFDAAEFAVDVTYTLAGGGDTALKGIFDADALQISLGANVDLLDTRPQVQLIAAQLPDGHANGDTLTIKGRQWRRANVAPDGHGLILIALEALG